MSDVETIQILSSSAIARLEEANWRELGSHAGYHNINSVAKVVTRIKQLRNYEQLVRQLESLTLQLQQPPANPAKVAVQI